MAERNSQAKRTAARAKPRSTLRAPGGKGFEKLSAGLQSFLIDYHAQLVADLKSARRRQKTSIAPSAPTSAPLFDKREQVVEMAKAAQLSLAQLGAVLCNAPEYGFSVE